LRSKVELGAGDARRSRGRYMFALILAVLMGLGTAVPVFAAQSDPDVQPSIVGGTAVPGGKYKFIAALRDVTRGTTAYQQQFCGGSLIDSNSVLTAAHCVEGATRVQLRVTVGRTVLNSNQGQTRSVAAIYKHPRYLSVRSQANDAAVLKLSSPVRGIAPAKIPTARLNSMERPGRTATIAGWGNTRKQDPDFSQPDSYPNQMREAKVPIVSDAKGKRVYGSSYVSSVMLAAGREGKDTCQGDSGGPIFVPTQSGRYQIGMTSFGAGCGARGFPGVYAEANSKSIRTFIMNAKRR
jgi:secreted trypsin-like serine protease